MLDIPIAVPSDQHVYSADKFKLSFHCSSASRQTWRLHFSFSWCSLLLTAPTQKKQEKVRKTMTTPAYPYLLTPTPTVIPFVTTYPLRNSVFFTFNKSETVWSNFANVLTFLKTSDVTPRNLYCKIWLDSSPIFSLGDKRAGNHGKNSLHPVPMIHRATRHERERQLSTARTENDVIIRVLSEISNL